MKKLQRGLNRLEDWGNRLPHPTLLFVYLCGFTLLLSWVCARLSISALNPITHNTIEASNLLSASGLQQILSKAVSNFTQFAPVGPVIVVTLGLGIAEASGLLKQLLNAIVTRTPKWALSYSIVFAGLISNIAADAGYVVLIPLAGLLFQQAGRHPLAGIAAAFAGVSGGYSANLLLGPVDVLLSGITMEAMQLLDSAESAHTTTNIGPASNYYFMLASTLVITFLGGRLTDSVVEPSLAPIDSPALKAEAKRFQSDQHALKHTLITAIGFIGLIALALWLHPSWLTSELGFSHTPFMQSLVPLIALFAAVCGLVYGFKSRAFKNHRDAINAMEATLGTLSGYLVLMFVAAQFINWFNWSQLGLITAIKGAELIRWLELTGPPLIVLMIVTTAGLNLLIGSASAKWALFAPIFVPMLMLSGVAPEAVQAAYRIGDSSTNIITPLMPYFPLVVAFVQQYDSKRGIGTLIAMMLPYSMVFLVTWGALLLTWMQLGWPLGA